MSEQGSPLVVVSCDQCAAPAVVCAQCAAIRERDIAEHLIDEIDRGATVKGLRAYAARLLARAERAMADAMAEVAS